VDDQAIYECKPNQPNLAKCSFASRVVYVMICV